MAQKIRRRVDIGGMIRWITAYSEQEYLLAASKLMLECGMLDGIVKAENNENEVQADNTDVQPIIFMPFASEWRERYKSQNRHTTKHSADSLYNKHLYPFFGEMLITSITIDTVQDFINLKVQQNYAAKSIKEMKMQLGMVLQAAVEKELIRINPARSEMLNIGTKKKTVRQPLTTKQALDVLANIHKLTKHKDRLYVALLLYTGMRRSEVLGLQGQDIDLETNQIYVRRGVTYSGNHPVVDTTKTEAGIRDIPLNPELLPFLPDLQSGCYLFAGHVETEPMSQQMVKNTWNRISKSINVYEKTPHFFRHTFVTFARRAGVDEKTLQTMGGYADIETMRRVYTHTQDVDLQLASKQLANMYSQDEEQPFDV